MSREQFEQWAKSEGLPVTIWGDQYTDDRTFSAWRGWQARGAVPVRLPSMPVAFGHDGKALYSADQIVEAIRAAGYKVEES